MTDNVISIDSYLSFKQLFLRDFKSDKYLVSIVLPDKTIVLNLSPNVTDIELLFMVNQLNEILQDRGIV